MCDQVRDDVTFFVPQSRGYLFDIPDLPSEVYCVLISLELYTVLLFYIYITTHCSIILLVYSICLNKVHIRNRNRTCTAASV